MSSSNYPFIVPSDFDIEDAFSPTNTPNYTPASPDYFLASPGNTSPGPLDDLSKYLLASLAISPFYDDPMAPKRTSTSAAPAMNQAAIQKLVANSVATALEAQVATMENTDNTNRNPRQCGTLVARKCSYKEFISYQPVNFKGPGQMTHLVASLTLNNARSCMMQEGFLPSILLLVVIIVVVSLVVVDGEVTISRTTK
nr:hypothetical protein [Tanacetum cinerariifolium]